MTDPPHEIRVIQIGSITVMNPRSRNGRVFNELVKSISLVGLKKPVTVTQRPGEPATYDLVCGQGRVEAFMQLGQDDIPAIIIDASEEDRHVMGLVENIARRHPSSLELLREIGVLKDRGYGNTEIAAKVGLSPDYVAALCYLMDHGENRLMVAVDRGLMPANVAMEIARAPEAEVQRALAEAYEAKTIPGNQILTIRRIIQLRALKGKGRVTNGPRPSGDGAVTASGLIRAYQQEVDRQTLLLKKSKLTQIRLGLIVNALRRLIKEDDFTAILHAVGMQTIPRPLSERLEVPEA
jgi:ParB family chromosome partitioning protein